MDCSVYVDLFAKIGDLAFSLIFCLAQHGALNKQEF